MGLPGSMKDHSIGDVGKTLGSATFVAVKMPDIFQRFNIGKEVRVRLIDFRTGMGCVNITLAAWFGSSRSLSIEQSIASTKTRNSSCARSRSKKDAHKMCINAEENKNKILLAMC